ncbi:hypothetical protein EMCRGX_G032311 [Ephydatia muelleri]
MVTAALMVTILCTHGHPSLHSWPPFSALIVTHMEYTITGGVSDDFDVEAWNPEAVAKYFREKGLQTFADLCEPNDIDVLRIKCYWKFRKLKPCESTSSKKSKRPSSLSQEVAFEPAGPSSLSQECAESTPYSSTQDPSDSSSDDLPDPNRN